MFKTMNAYFIIALVAMGLGYEGLKLIKNKKHSDPSLKAEINRLNLEPYSRSDAQLAKSPSRFQQHRSLQVIEHNQIEELPEDLSAQGDQTIPTNQEKNGDTKKEKSVVKKDTEFEFVIDENGNLVKKKKNKKKVKKTKVAKKNEDKKKEEEQVSEEDAEDDQDEAVAQANAVSQQAIVAPAAKEPQDQKDPAFLSLEEWKRRLLNQPDFQQTTLFIEQYKTNMVTPAIFYQIVNLMLEDARPQMREYAIVALGSTPSYQSFTTLAKVIQTEPFSSPVRQKADNYLRVYTQLNNLQYLSSVLANSPSPTAVILAAQKLGEAVRLHLGPEIGKQDGQTSPTASAKNSRYFTGFVSILENVTRTAVDPIAADEANKVLIALRELLKTTA